jgi:hypothetical protein
VNEPWPGEATHAQMLSGLFGGEFSSTGTVAGINFHRSGGSTTDAGYTNGSFRAVRLSDTGGTGTQNLENLAGGDDTMFGRGSYEAKVIGGYSSLSHQFGTVGSTGQFESLLSSGSNGARRLHPRGEFAWGLSVSNGSLYSTDTLSNGGGIDAAVTYAVYDQNDAFVGAVLFFEDWTGVSSDFDYNDFAVLLTLAPTPNAAMLGLAGLGGLGVISGRRRR